MNSTYEEFVRELFDDHYHESSPKVDRESLLHLSHGSNKKSFKMGYKATYQQAGTKIYHLDDPVRLRIGYVVERSGTRVWNTVRLGAWGNYQEFKKDILGEKK